TFPIFSLFLPHWLFMPSPFFPLQILMLFSVGLIFGLGVVLIVRQISRGVWGGDKRKLETLEKRLMSHTDPHEVLIDLDALISENLRLKRPQVAEFYSKQLLLISEKLDSHETPKIELMLSEAAWVSTPAYHKRVNYWLVWLFESRGTLSLTSKHL